MQMKVYPLRPVVNSAFTFTWWAPGAASGKDVPWTGGSGLNIDSRDSLGYIQIRWVFLFRRVGHFYSAVYISRKRNSFCAIID